MAWTSSALPPSYRAGTAVNPYPQQFPGMQLNMPLSMFQPSQPSNELIGLHGLDSAKQYPMKPNTTVPTFDLDSDHAFILNTDANGVMSVKILSFKVISEEEYRKKVEAESPIQLQRSEYNDLLNRMKTMEEELENAKQLIREQSGADGSRSVSAKSTTKPAASYDDSDF